MDRVRFGRALGFGARAAAKTLMSAAEAAAAPAPERPQRATVPSPAARAAGAATARSVQQISRAARQAPAAARQGVLQPVKRFTSVVMLQVTGTFFTVFALSLGTAAWKLRATLHTGGGARFSVVAVLAAVFAYFAVSSFARARRR